MPLGHFPPVIHPVVLLLELITSFTKSFFGTGPTAAFAIGLIVKYLIALIVCDVVIWITYLAIRTKPQPNPTFPAKR